MAGGAAAFSMDMKRRPAGRVSVSIAVLLSLAPPLVALPSAAPSTPKGQLISCAVSKFESPRWSPVTYGYCGLIYDNRPEPRQIEIEDLTKRADADPEDAATRDRLVVLLRQEQRGEEATKRHEEAVAIYRRRLKADPADARTMAWLAIAIHTTPEGLELATQAVKAGPDCWEAWCALAVTQARRTLVLCFEDMPGLKEGEVDLLRLQPALTRVSGSKARSEAILELGGRAVANALKAIELAPKGVTDAYLRFLAIRLEMTFVLNNLRLKQRERVPAIEEADRESMNWLQKGLPICRDDPQALGLLGLLSFQNLMAHVPRGADGQPEAKALAQRQTEVLGPFMLRLQELSETAPPERAALAGEAYASLVLFVQLLGGQAISSSELPALLDRVVRVLPRRCLAWETRIFIQEVQSNSSVDSNVGAARQIALKRQKVLPTPRSQALVATTSLLEDEAAEWRKAVNMAPSDVEYRLNLATALVRHDATAAQLDEALRELQKATELGYEQEIWQSQPGLDMMRQRTFIVQQALSGQLDRAREACAAYVQQFPDNREGPIMQQALAEWK